MCRRIFSDPINSRKNIKSIDLNINRYQLIGLISIEVQSMCNYVHILCFHKYV